MAYHPGLQLATVTVGGASTLESGESLILSAQITASRSLLWVDGDLSWHYDSDPKTVDGTLGSELSIELLPCDIQGFRTQNNQIIDVSVPGSYTHLYNIRVSKSKMVGNKKVPVGTPRDYSNVFIPTGDGSPVDLDTLLPVGTQAGGVVQVPDTWDARVAAAEAIVATYGAHAYNLRAAGLDDATTNITTVMTAAIAAGHRHLLIPYRATPWPMTSRLDAADVWIEFEPGARVSFDLNARAMDLTRVRLTNASFTSAYTGPTVAADNNVSGPYGSLEAREVRLNDGCVVEGYYHENASHGLNITAGSHITIRDAEFKNIRHGNGWGAAIHIAGSGSYNIRIDGVRIENADRGIEVEAGARDVWAEGGHLKNVYPVPYPGQPAGFATYTFVLDAHSHEGETACINITYRNFLLENCGGGVTFVRSNGTNATDLPRSCLAENIRILGRTMTTGYETIAVQGYNNLVRGVHLMEGAGITALMRARIWGGGSENNRLLDLRAEAYALPLVTVDDGATGTVLGNARAGAPLTGSGYIFDIAGRYTCIQQASAFSVAGTLGYARFTATADYSKIDGFNYNLATGETFPQVILIEGAEHVQITNVQGSNFATVPPVDVSISGSARFANIVANNFDRSAAGAVIAIGAGASRNLVRGNMIATSLGTITNAGADNTVEGNKRGNWSDFGKGTATIPDGASSVTFNHGVAGAPELAYVSPRIGELIWISAITSTQLTVSRVGSSGAHLFDWRAENNPTT